MIENYVYVVEDVCKDECICGKRLVSSMVRRSTYKTTRRDCHICIFVSISAKI